MDYQSCRNPLASFNWDLPLELPNSETSLLLQSSPFTPIISSTGYLEDALCQWTEPCKRRRLLPISDDEMSPSSERSLHERWGSYEDQDPCLNYGCPSFDCDFEVKASEDPLSSSIITAASSGSTPSPETAKKTHEHVPSPSSSDKEPTSGLLQSNQFPRPEKSGRRWKKPGSKVAYPFAMLKPGGVEGDVTLCEINERLLMRPTRPVRHPVGDFACLPAVSAGGPGLSGKDVVALTRIHTQGNGTITIVRTKG